MQTVTNDFTQIERIARPVIEAIGDQLVLSQGRCVDVLLDLYCATDDVGLKWSIADRLHEISHLTAVLAEDIRADLEAIIAIAESGSAIGLDWIDGWSDSPSELKYGSCSDVRGASREDIRPRHTALLDTELTSAA